jgi:Fe-S cluster biosynthesis and repair protein YggX
MTISEQRIGNDVRGSGRENIWDIIPEPAWSDWVKPRKTTVSITGLKLEVWNLDVLNMKQIL